MPVGTENSIAEVLGISIGIDACDILAKRRKLFLDVGWLNNKYFISQLHIPPSDIEIEYDESFKVASRGRKMELVVCNLKPFVWSKGGKKYVVHPQDGKLEAFLRPIVKTGVFKKEQFDSKKGTWEQIMKQKNELIIRNLKRISFFLIIKFLSNFETS